jgi:uncharacterized protein with ParB-like and HNH nuclease domain
LLLNIPIPVIYFSEQSETLNYEVIDGQQRLRTLLDFFDDKFSLQNLEIRIDINEKKFSELVEKDRNEIRKRSIRAIVLLNESDEEIKFEVFERLNLGSLKLTPQEIRNNTFRGEFNNLLKKLANNEKFIKMFKQRLKNDKTNMAYEELILRFFAYSSKDLKRTENLSFFLTKFMKEKQNISQDELVQLENRFTMTIDKIFEYLGEDRAFSVYKKDSNS